MDLRPAEDIPLPPERISLLSAPDDGLLPTIRLAARLYAPRAAHHTHEGSGPTRLPALVVGHGAGSRASRHEKFCLDAVRHRFVVLAVDFRGHGSSQGAGDGPLEHDLLAAAAFLRDHPAVDPALICYRGSSMGAFYGLKAQPMAGFLAMVLLCPANETTMLRAIERDDPVDSRGDTEGPEPCDVGTEASTWSEADDRSADPTRWDRPRMQSYFHRQDSEALAGLVTCPVMLVHALGDAVVPFAHSRHLAEHLRDGVTLIALPEGSHSSAQHDPQVHLRSLEWLSQKTLEAKKREEAK